MRAVSGECCCAVVLAAGASRRLGRPKQTVVIDGETLVERTVRVVMEAELSPVIVVVSPDAEFVDALRERGCLIVVNEGGCRGDGGFRFGVAWRPLRCCRLPGLWW